MSYNKNTRLISAILDKNKKESFLSKKDFLRLFNENQKKWITEFKSIVQMFFGGRRGGKTIGNIGKVLYCDLYYKPKIKSLILIIASTKDSARDLYWHKIKKFNQKFKLGYKFKDSSLRITTPRNEIVLLGLFDYKSVSKKLGQAVKLVVIDEAQTLKDSYLKEFIDDVSVWSGFDHEGITCLSGNPPAQHFGTIYEMWTNKDNGVFKMSTNIYQNPRFTPKQIEERLAFERKRRGLKKGEEDAQFKRMVEGKWVIDNSSVIFKPKEINFYDSIPAGSYSRVVGLDFGMVHHDAIIVLAYSTKTKEIYLEYEWQKSRQDIASTCEKVIDVCDKFDAYKVIFDPGGMGSKVGLELENRYSKGRINFESANTKEKMSWIEILKSEIESGKFKMKKNGIFHQECPQILYDEDRKGTDDKKGLHSDIMPAIIYAMKDVYNHSEESVSTDYEKRENAKINMKEYLNELYKRENDPYYESHIDFENLRNDDISY